MIYQVRSRVLKVDKPYITLLALFLPTFIWAYFFTVPAEDAVILYEYSKNLAERGLITYGGSSQPIEGATDFFWMLIIAAMRKMGINEFAAALTLNFLGLAIVLILFNRTKDKIWICIAAILTPYFYASLSGFSAMFFVSIYLVSLKLFFAESKWVYLSILFLCLLRPDGVAWGAGIVILKLLKAQEFSKLKTELRNLLLYFIIPSLIYFAWRVSYFSELFPLPFLVKSGQPRDLGIFYYGSFRTVVLVLVPLGLTFLIFARQRNLFLQFALLFTPPTMFYSSVVLEQNVGNRFMAPLFFGTVYFLFVKFGLKALTIAVVISAVIGFKSTVGTTLSLVDSNNENVPNVARDLSYIQGRMLITEAGRLTYYSGWISEDSWGLNTPQYAKKLIRIEDVSPNKYDLIVAHCDLTLLKTVIVIDSFPDRSWLNQCKVLVEAIKQNKYQVYLLPYRRDTSVVTRIKGLLSSQGVLSRDSFGCTRHDVYAVSPKFDDSVELVNILRRYGAIKFQGDLSTVGDAVCGVVNK